MTPERHRQIATIYHASVDLTSGERTAFLDTACAGDLALRQEVESLLALHEQAGSFLEEPASEVMAELLARDQASLTEGQLIGHYRTLGLLGEGGMGEVYLADDISLGRRVALKLLPSQFTRDADRLRRFKQEARAIAALNHPNIITIYEIGETAGIHYIATEFIDGQTLRQRMNSEAMKPSDAVEIAAHVASALVAAHDSGVVHRDIKPENIMVRKDGLVKVLDFGLAKFAEASAAGVENGLPANPGMTTAGVVMGTVRYMSPEQVRGMNLDARSDIFSLGVVLHEMLAGQSPFADATTADEVAAILGREAPPIALSFPETQEALQRILTRALRKEREERYQTAQQMLDDLKGLRPVLEAEGERTTVSSVSSWRAQMPLARGHVVPAKGRGALLKVMVALAMLTLTSFAVWMFSSNRNGSPAPAPITSLAILPLVNLSHDPEQEFFADGMTEELSTQLANIGSLRVLGPTSVMRYKSTTKTSSEIAAELKVDALVKGSVLSSGGKIKITVRLIRAGREERPLWAQEYDRDAQDVLTLLHTVARDIAREIKIQMSLREQQRLSRAEPVDPAAHTENMRGRHFWNRGDVYGLQQALIHFHKARDIAPAYAAPYAGLADTYIDMGFGGLMAPKDAYEAARTAAMEALDKDPELAEAHVSWAVVLNDYDWNWTEAESHFKRALDLNPSYSTGHWWYASHLAARGRSSEAISEARIAARDLDPGSLKANFTLGDTYYFAGEYALAVDSYKRVVELNDQYSPIYEALAIVYEITEMPEEAFTEYQNFLTTGGVPEVEAFEKAYRSGGMPAYLRKLLDLEEEDYKQGNGVWPLRRASLYARLGEKELALHWIDEAFDWRDPHLQNLGVDPVFKSLRGDPRFRKFLERLQLPAGN